MTYHEPKPWNADEAPLLTVREREVLDCVAAGLTDKQVAQMVGIMPRTVERHIENLRHKIRARNRAHLIAKAFSYGLLATIEDA